MTRLNWLLACVALGAILLAGCNSTPEAPPGTASEPTKTDTTSAPVTKGDETPVAKTGETDPKTEADPKAEASKPADPKDEKATAAKADAAKADSSRSGKEETVQTPIKTEKTEVVATTKIGPDGKAHIDPKAPGMATNVTSKPVPQKDPTPADVDKAATNAKFAGTWKRFIDPKLRVKYEKVAAIQKKRGKKLYPVDNILALKADGTFVWDDNALITGRKVTGTWSVKGGIATFAVKTIDGKAPTKTEAAAFEASVAKSGKMLYRGNTARGRYDKA